MAGLPNIQTAQYGDRVALEKLGAMRRTNNPAADVNAMKVMEGGRPAVTDPVQLAIRAIQQGGRQQQGRSAQPQELQLSPAEQQHQLEFDRLAKMYRDTVRMLRVAARPNAGELTRDYAIGMLEAYKREFFRVRRETPFFMSDAW